MSLLIYDKSKVFDEKQYQQSKCCFSPKNKFTCTLSTILTSLRKQNLMCVKLGYNWPGSMKNNLNHELWWLRLNWTTTAPLNIF